MKNGLLGCNSQRYPRDAGTSFYFRLQRSSVQERALVSDCDLRCCPGFLAEMEDQTSRELRVHSGYWCPPQLWEVPPLPPTSAPVTWEIYKFPNGKGGRIKLMSLWNIVWKNQVHRTLSGKEYTLATSLKKYNRVVIIKNITQQLGLKENMDFSQERKPYTNHLPNICGLHFKTYLNEGSTGHLWTKLIPKIELPTY